MDKHTKNLIRICASLAGLIVVFIIDKVAGPKQYILGVLYGIVYLSIGWDVLLQAAKNIGRGKLFDENFLMSIATVGAFVIGEYPEAVAVMLFYQVGELFQSYAIGKSRRSIAALMDIRPDKAVVIRDGVEISRPKRLRWATPL